MPSTLNSSAGGNGGINPPFTFSSSSSLIYSLILLAKDLDNKTIYLSNNVSDYFYLPQMPKRLFFLSILASVFLIIAVILLLLYVINWKTIPRKIEVAETKLIYLDLR